MPNFRTLLLGRRLASEESHETRISNPIALAVFSSDALSSVAYGTQEIMAPLTAAIAIFGFAWTGISVSQANQQEFAAGQPWDYVASSPVEGGHSIITGGYGTPGAGPLGGDERFITWAAETSFTDAFWANEVEEAWVAIWPEHLSSRAFLAGISLTQLAADYQSITGKPLPLPPQPVPPPAPVPPAPPAPPAPKPVPPAPAPAVILEQLAEAIRSCAASANRDWTELLAFLASHGL